jgi:hypothetical protein
MNKFIIKDWMNNHCYTDRSFQSFEEARDYAIEWQAWQSEQSLYMSELMEWQAYFEALAQRFDLTDEFKENGII